MFYAQKKFLTFWIFLLKLHRVAIRKPALILSLTALVMLVSFFNLTNIKTLYAVHDIEDPSLIYAQKFREARKDFELGSSMFISFKPADANAFTQIEISKIRSWIGNQDYANSKLLNIGSPFDIRLPSISSNEIGYYRLLNKNLPEELAALKKTPWLGILTSKNADDLSVDLGFKGETQSQFFGSFDPRPVGEVIKSLKLNFPKVGAFFVAGEAVFQFFCHEGIQRNNELNFYLLVFLLMTFRFIFGTWRSGLAFVLTLLVMAITTFGTMSAFNIPIDLISSGLFLILAVAALEDYLFFCSEQLQRQTPWKKAMRKILVPSFFTSLTTILGFGSLAMTNMLIMKRFGIWAAFGSLIEWISCFIVLPALMMKLSFFRNLTDVKKAYRPDISARFLNLKLNRNFARGLLFIFGTGLFALFHLNISGAPKDMMTAEHPFIQGLADLKASRGWEGIVQIIFEKAQDPPRNLIAKIEKLENVTQVLSPNMIEEFFTKDLMGGIKSLALGDLQESDFFKSFFAKNGRSRVLIYVKDTRTEPMMKFIKQVELICENKCFAASEAAAHAEFSERVPEAFIESFATSLALLGVVLVLLVRFLSQAPRPYLSVLLSSMWGPFLVLTFFWIFNTKINFMACLFMSVLIGLAGDNAIQFLFASRKRNLNEGVLQRGSGSLIISLLIAGSCLIFLGSYFVSPRVYGIFLGIGILVSTFGDIWLLKAWRRNEALKPSQN